ncbi:serine hydrolase domain-containing protein [Microlunatus parietis]|uniref:CubicO group peptidase (Beta-lactamase class C family) n=1 Tax=Microlunatus parietis TaxID=682979 RepID=A0A7Y9I9Z5_9ACTN|nr:serine hydrolase domain-containing protein [Microlunatus parietis]NYE72514.1 CubicO group peptidase (beta-lactamase class C family) [Microlunatus parietis]
MISRWLRRILAGILILAAGAGLGLWWSADEPPRLWPPRDLAGTTAALDRELPGLLAATRVPAAAVALVSGDRVIFSRGYGIAGGSGAPVTGDTVFQAGSISKTVAAAALVGHYPDRLDEPIVSRLRGWTLPPGGPDPEAITLRRLLSHTAGMNVSGYLGTVQGGSTIDSLNGRTGADPVRQSEAPGPYRYSGGGYTVAQLFAESDTGRPFADLVHDQVLAPLRLERSGFGCGAEVVPGHDQHGRPTPGYRYPEAAAAGLCSTANDLGRFAAWLGSADPVAVRLRTAEAGTDGKYGLGVEIDHPDHVGHLGVNRGYYARLVVNPRERFGVVVLTNGDRGSEVVSAVLRLLR